MNRVLLTGGSGKLGRYVRSALVAQDFDVRNFDKVSCRSDIDQVQADILDRKRLESAMIDRDMVIHLAALDAAVPATEQAFFEINVQGTWNVLEAAERPVFSVWCCVPVLPRWESATKTCRTICRLMKSIPAVHDRLTV